jgi:taurine dioxygenase
MISTQPSGQILGATVTGIDLAQPLDEGNFGAILRSLGEYGVLRFPEQRLDATALRDFSHHFGSIQGSVTGQFADAAVPEVGILSNIVENGQPIGLADAGQDWHTDMSYNRTIGFLNVLYAVKVPRRNGQVLGATAFADMGAAYNDLSSDVKSRLEDATATHDFNKFWELMRSRSGSERAALTDEQRRKRPASVHPLFMVHPVTGRRVLYCNPGYAMRINELAPDESDRMLESLFEHQLQPRYRYVHTWQEGDVLMWDHIRTIHMAVADYGPEEHRLMLRCQVMADRVFDGDAFQRSALAAAAGRR